MLGKNLNVNQGPTYPAYFGCGVSVFRTYMQHALCHRHASSSLAEIYEQWVWSSIGTTLMVSQYSHIEHLRRKWEHRQCPHDLPLLLLFPPCLHMPWQAMLLSNDDSRAKLTDARGWPFQSSMISEGPSAVPSRAQCRPYPNHSDISCVNLHLIHKLYVNQCQLL